MQFGLSAISQQLKLFLYSLLESTKNRAAAANL